MIVSHRSRRIWWLATALCLSPNIAGAGALTTVQLQLVDRLSWGSTPALVREVSAQGFDHWLDVQLRDEGRLPPEAQRQVDAMRISHLPVAALIDEHASEIKAAGKITDPAQKLIAVNVGQLAMKALWHEAETRSLLRDLYATDQLREQMTWFWLNHFSVQAGKREIRISIGDYEEQAIRSHALGKFRDLLEATLRHPAMLAYLDNDQNALGHINENYAREILELHTLGVGSGYTQKDVQELARILTGVGVNAQPVPPKLKPEWQHLYIRDGAFEFNPARHDFGDKIFLGHQITGSGFAEVEQALDLIAASPATAHHVAVRLATYFAGDSPPPALVDRMAAKFTSSGGDITAVLLTMIGSPEFVASLGKMVKDPVHFTISALRLSFGDRVILNIDPVIGWLNVMDERLYGRATPDGYPLESAAWMAPGQMNTRFFVAHDIGAGAGGLFQPPPNPVLPAAKLPTGPMTPILVSASVIKPAPPLAVVTQLRDTLAEPGMESGLNGATTIALAQARTPAEWNGLFLSSPDFMRR
jgi:uncharacterized protein (DUF1800 family)